MNGRRRPIRFVLIPAVVGAGVVCRPAMFAQSGSDTAAVTELEQRLTKAVLSKDAKTYSAILAPDWSVIDASGRELSKEQVMVQTFGNPELKVASAVNDGMNVRTYGDTAIVTGRTIGTSTLRGARANIMVRFMDVFVRKNGHWMLVGSQRTAIAQ